MHKIGLADTTFARYDMGRVALGVFEEHGGFEIVRYTVPGVKDLPAAAKRLFDQGCEAVLAIGMPGPLPIDKECAHEASQGIIMCQILTGKHILECFVHEDEADSSGELANICKDRSYKHAWNLIRLLTDPEWFVTHAGQGLRQGHPDAGPLL